MRWAGFVSIALLAAACQVADPAFSCSTAPNDTESSGSAALVLGDYGHGDGTAAVAGAMRDVAATLDVAAVVTTGDNFYDNDGDAAFCRPFEWVVSDRIPVWAAWGNHDIDEPARVRLMREVLGATDRWYARSLGGWTVLVLDSNEPGDGDQQQWLEAQLEAAEAAGRPVVAVFHHSVYSCGRHGSNPRLVESWAPLFARHGVALVLTGHDHHYQRFVVDGVTYVVTGAGGRSLRPFHPCLEGTPDPLAVEHDVYSFVTLEVEGTVVRLTSIAADGRVIDEAIVSG